jgi:OmpA-OmpF porin, OOP family
MRFVRCFFCSNNIYALLKPLSNLKKATVKKKYLRPAALTLVACAISGAAIAQTTSDNMSYSGSYMPSYIVGGASAANPDNKFGSDERTRGFGLRLGVPISPMWDLQLGSNYGRYRDGALRYQQNTLGLDALYLFSRSSFRPFLMLGAGAEYNKINIGGGEIHRTSPYISGGAGVQVSLSDRWGMQADFRRSHTFLNGDTFGFKRANTSTVFLGLSYSYGNPTTPMRATRMTEPAAPMAPAPAPPAPPPMAQAPAPAPVVPPPVAAPAPPRFERYTLSATELFAFDSATLRMPQQKLDEISDALARNPQVNNVTITGYTDRLGSDKYNLALSQRRADAVKNYMSSKGVASTRLTANGRGESDPVVMCNEKKRADLIVCLEPNRRVEVDQIVIERRVP